MKSFIVRVNEIKAMLVFASDDESRFILNGVHFEIKPNQFPLLISTDGRRLAALSSDCEQPENQEEFSLTLSSDFLKSLCSFASKHSANVRFEFHPSLRIVAMLGTHCAVDVEKGAVIEGDYPKWREVCPTGDKSSVNQLAINSGYIGDIAKVAKILKKEAGIKAHLFSDTSAIEVLISGCPNFYSVIMPMRSEPVDKWQPDFLGIVPAVKQAA